MGSSPIFRIRKPQYLLGFFFFMLLQQDAVFSTYRDGTQIGESAMIVIDSENGEYEKIDMPGKLGYKLETVSEADD